MTCCVLFTTIYNTSGRGNAEHSQDINLMNVMIMVQYLGMTQTPILRTNLLQEKMGVISKAYSELSKS